MIIGKNTLNLGIVQFQLNRAPVDLDLGLTFVIVDPAQQKAWYGPKSAEYHFVAKDIFCVGTEHYKWAGWVDSLPVCEHIGSEYEKETK